MAVTYFDPSFFFTSFVFCGMVAACPNVCCCRWTIAGKQELIHNGFSYLIEMRIFKEVSNVLHFLQGEAVSLGVTFVFWCFL